MDHVIAIAGNPNCGKTTLFNALTGSTQKVGNWPGVTVEKKVGSYRFDGVTYTLVDLPGVYMVGGVTQGSEDERVARDYILSGEPELVVNIVDGCNLERNLYLTAQLLEMRVPVVVAVNMMDIATRHGITVDLAALSRVLDCPVVPLIASHQKGIADLKGAVARAIDAKRIPQARPVQSAAVTQAVTELSKSLAEAAAARNVDPSWAALKLIEGDAFAEALAGGKLDGEVIGHRTAIEDACGDEADIIIADGRFAFVAEIMAAAVTRKRRMSKTLSARIDQVVLNRYLGVPVFLFAMYLMFLFTINIGGSFIDFFDQTFAALLVDEVSEGLAAIGTPDLVIALAKGLGSGIQTVATFVPVIACLFLFLSFLEDSGYMARAAFVMDRAMRSIGLPGKSFVPLIVGFGCNVPAIMATRTLESRRDRILTIMMAPFMSCGARLPVFALFAAAFFPENGQNVVFGLYLLGLVFAVMTGLLLKSTLLPGEPTRFVMELPPYHMPTLRGIVIQAWQRLREFIFRAGRIIVPMVMILSFFNTMGTDGSFGKENTRESVLASASQVITPLFHPIGLNNENWPAAVGLFTGIFAKEAIVGTLNALYSQIDGDQAATAEAPPAPTLAEKLEGAVMTIPPKLAKVADSLADPLGINISYVGDSEAAATELKVTGSVFGAMVARFDGVAGAFAYMLLILLYTPCIAASGAIRHESGGAWTAFAAVWTTTLGYVSAVAFYQAATFSRDPVTATGWLVGCGVTIVAGITLMWLGGRRQVRRLTMAAAE
jgi:ferrous iron transport protein B